MLQSIESTNSHLLQQAILTGRAKLCLSESQSAGRGRRGNDWQSAPYRNIMMSLSWGFDHWPETITGLGLAVSLVVAEQLNQAVLPATAERVTIKWPNDLMSGKDKLGGILIDVAGEASGACNVVIGLGLNVHQPDWSSNGDYHWQDLHSLGVDVTRNHLAALLASELVQLLTEFSDVGFAPMSDRWNALNAYAGKLIRVGAANDYVEGVMLGVDSSGALLLEDKCSVTHRLSDSNASVRLV